MANTITMGARKAMTVAFTAKEVARHEHIDRHFIMTGFQIIPVKGTIMEREVTVDGRKTGRTFECICVIRHGDGNFHCEKFSFGWLSGKEASSEAKATIEMGRSGKYYLKYKDARFNAPSLPIQEGQVDFAYEFALEVGEEFQAYALKDFSFSFEEKKGYKKDEERWVNTKEILDRVAKNELEVDLTPVSRFNLTQKLFDGRFTKKEEAAAQQMYRGFLGTK